MYKTSLELAKDYQLLTEFIDKGRNYTNLPLISKLREFSDYQINQMELSLLKYNNLTFDIIYNEIIGKYLIDEFITKTKIYLKIKNNEITNENLNLIGDYEESLINYNSKQQNIIHENYLKLHLFPIFCKSKYYKLYLKCKLIEENKYTKNEFEKIGILGRGAFGIVYAYKNKDTNKLYAVKSINKRRLQVSNSVNSIMNERNILSLLNNKFVISLKYSFEGNISLYLVIDLMIGGDLKYHLNKEIRFNQIKSKFYASEILLGLQYLHSKNIIYRDLKLENILLDNKGHIKLCDFGISIISNDNNVNGTAGTLGYMAPEIILKQYYGREIDYFSLGVIIFTFLQGKKPFDTIIPVYLSIRKRYKLRVIEYDPLYNKEYFDSTLKSLLKGLLCKNGKNRLGYNGIHEIKNHPWFDDINFEELANHQIEPPFIPSLSKTNVRQREKIG